jgi:hypothetical protein
LKPDAGVTFIPGGRDGPPPDPVGLRSLDQIAARCDPPLGLADETGDGFSPRGFCLFWMSRGEFRVTRPCGFCAVAEREDFLGGGTIRTDLRHPP